MSLPPTQVIAAWVKESLIDTEWVRLRAVALSVTVLRTKRSEDEAADYIDEKLSYLAENLRDDFAECASDGRILEFEIDSDSDPYIRRRTASKQDLLNKLRGIDPFVFEDVCARILSALGADAHVTARTNDGGIDFTATKLKIVPSLLPLPQTCHGIVIGQAKRYREGSNISEVRLREFVGAALLRRHVLASSLSLSPLAPTIYAFWTTSDFDANGRRFARNVGVWYMDGPTLASYVDDLGLKPYIMSL